MSQAHITRGRSAAREGSKTAKEAELWPLVLLAVL